jgi:hypothetical protein
LLSSRSTLLVARTFVTTLNNVSELSLYLCSVLSKTLLSTVIVQVQNVSKDQVKSEFDELHKECHLRKWYCLSEFENDLAGKSNQVLATEYRGYLLVYILQDMSQSVNESYL